MGQEWHASKDERLLREARRLLRLALTHTNLRESEPRRVCRRLISVSYAAMGSVSRAA